MVVRLYRVVCYRDSLLCKACFFPPIYCHYCILYYYHCYTQLCTSTMQGTDYAILSHSQAIYPNDPMTPIPSIPAGISRGFGVGLRLLSVARTVYQGQSALNVLFSRQPELTA